MGRLRIQYCAAGTAVADSKAEQMVLDEYQYCIKQADTYEGLWQVSTENVLLILRVLIKEKKLKPELVTVNLDGCNWNMTSDPPLQAWWDKTKDRLYSTDVPNWFTVH